ncbi:MAG: excinuclease ABC subunit UvrB [Candidatus Liptonbacteria bacterium]
MPINNELLRLIGYYIAEGHATANYFTLSSADSEVISDFNDTLSGLGLHCYKRPGTYDYAITSRIWSVLFSEWCGKTSSEKRLPPFWAELADEQLASVLSAYFSTDGGVDGSGVSCTTASPDLASDLSYALLRFGIVSRIRERYIKLPGKMVRNKYFSVCIYGSEYSKIFEKKIGFLIIKKQNKLHAIIKNFYNTNVDVIPSVGTWIKDMRHKLFVSQEKLAIDARISRPLLSFIESGLRSPSRRTFMNVVTALESCANTNNHNKRLIESIANSKNIANAYWSKIKSIEKIPGEDYVYDFAVEDNETFLAGRGGMFVHNTFTVANVIARTNKPTLVIAHNKTLAAQLCNEFRELFPKNAVHYFVSYYDYYQPEAYIPTTDTYIGKEAMINDEIDKLRHAATAALLTRDDVIVVASVSCIYGLGAPEAYAESIFHFKTGDVINRKEFSRRLIELQFSRTSSDLTRGTFRLRGDNWEIMPPDREVIYNFELDGNKIVKIFEINPVQGFVPGKTPTLSEIYIAPAKHFITPPEERKRAIEAIRSELKERLKYFEENKKYLEAERLERRTKYDLAMIEEIGYCHGIENYSRHLSGRPAGAPPDTLLDYFRGDFLTVIDESHVTVPQIQGMYEGDASRKKTLIEYGFRLPSAADNRPLRFTEFEERVSKTIYTSATPGPFEREHSAPPHGQIVEQIIRPTGLIDPKITMLPARGQVDDLIPRIEERVALKERILVTTLTKRMAEDLSNYLEEKKMKVSYLHSDVKTLDRIRILTDLRKGNFDVLVGVNLLREGLDLPEVTLVAILDADKEGFLRSETSLVQTIGRAARNVRGEVLIYADNITGSIKRAVSETERRRKLQLAYNEKHGIVPTTIIKEIRDILPVEEVLALEMKPVPKSRRGIEELMKDKEREMKEAAKRLDFELAAILRDEIGALAKELRKGKSAKTGKIIKAAAKK